MFIVDRLETGFLIVALLLLSGALYAFVEPSAMQRVLSLTYLGVGVLFILRRPNFSRQLTRRLLVLIVLVVAAPMLSVFWSEAPHVSLRRAVALIGTMGLGTYLATAVSSERLFQLLRLFAGAVVILNVIHIVLGFDTSQSVGAGWIGTFAHKNALGRTSALCALILLAGSAAPALGRGIRLLNLLGVGGGAFLVVHSNSATGLVILAVGAAVLLMRPLLRYKWHFVALTGLIVGPVALLMATNLEVHMASVFDALGRDATLTGRTALWNEVVAAIRQRPLLGYGFGAFWIPENAVALGIRQRLAWEVPHAHNGMLESALQVGVVGVAGLATVLISLLATSIWRARIDARGVRAWELCLVVAVLVGSLTEAVAFEPNTLYTTLIVAALLSRALEVRGDAGPRSAGGP